MEKYVLYRIDTKTKNVKYYEYLLPSYVIVETLLITKAMQFNTKEEAMEYNIKVLSERYTIYE